MDFEEVKKEIREAFKNVTKGDSMGLREAVAVDDYATPEEQAKARALDVEQHWWDISGDFSAGLIYGGSPEGVRFILPAAMSDCDTHSVHMCLCFPYDANAPHHGHKEYINYLRSVNPKKIASYYEFTEKQLHAIGLFLKWWMQDEKIYLYTDRQKQIERLKRSNEKYRQAVSLENYNLTLDDEIAFFDEECRVLRDWLELGKVSV